MGWQHWVMIVMFAASAVLPVVGLLAAYSSSTKWYREYWKAPPSTDGDGMSIGQFSIVTKQIHSQMKGKPAVALRDVLLIGIGVVLGAAASIWAVVDSVI